VAQWLLGGRWLLAFVFGAAALAKLIGSRDLPDVVRRYNVVPDAFVPALARTLVPGECLVALALAVGVLPRFAAAVAAVALITFATAIAVNLVRGRRFDCGCGGSSSEISWWLVARNLGLAAIAAAVVLGPSTGLALVSGPGAGHPADGIALAAVPLAAAVLCLIAAVAIRCRVSLVAGWEQIGRQVHIVAMTSKDGD
jgi:uncharacterized membrane protein YphA (DoxX/SURF4 family)